jgi:hypothetical protein
VLNLKIEKILEYIASKSDFLKFNEDIFNILEGDLVSYVDKALENQLLSKQAYESAREGISPINIIKKVTDKLTKLYASNVRRIVTVENEPSEKNQEIVDYYVKKLNVDKFMNDFNYFMNSTKTSLIEPYLSRDNKPKIRVIPSHQYLVWSDDIIEPNKPTVLIKLMGKKKFGDKELDVYFLYSDDEFIAINSEGDILNDYMEGNEGLNVYGVIPATYGNMSDYLLMPKPDTDLFRMCILFCLSFTHSNDAIKYMSYSIVYGVDIESDSLERNPNVFWYFKSEQNKTPQIGQIKPEVDTSKVIENIMVQFDSWLETKGIKVSNAGRARGDNNLSGISMIIKEMDTIQALKSQMSKMEFTENDFWKRMAKIHNYWVLNGIVKDKDLMDENINVKVEYELPKPIESEDERLDRAIKARKEMLATTKEAIKIWKPRLSEEELNQMIEELEEEFSFKSQENLNIESNDQENDQES